MKKRFLLDILFSFFLGLVIVSCSKEDGIQEITGTGVIYGKLVDDKGEPLQGAAITLYPSGRTVVTGSNGQYEFRELPDDGYLLQISKNGYLSNTESVTLSQGTQMQMDVSMTAGDPCLDVLVGELYFGDNATSKVFVVSNVGDRTINWNLYTDYDMVLEFDKTSGTLKPGENTSVNVSLNRTLTNADLNSFPIYVYAEGEELGVIATINRASAGMNNSLLVGNWALVYNVFWSESDGKYLYNKQSGNSFIYTFNPDYTCEVNDRRMVGGADPSFDEAEDYLSYMYYVTDYNYDPASNVLVLNEELDFDKVVYRINKLTESTLEIESIQLKDSKKYEKLTFSRL